MESTKILEDEFAKFEDWYKAIIFDKNCNIIAKKNCDKLKEGELKEFLTVFDDRDTTIGKGFMFCGYHFDAHRFHPPLHTVEEVDPKVVLRRQRVYAVLELIKMEKNILW